MSNQVNSEKLAYVIFTSGSTGEPKGVAIAHRPIINLLKGLEQSVYQNDNSYRRVSMNGSLAFDTSVKQVIQLLHGHTLDIIPEEIRLQPREFISYLQQHRIDVLDSTPSQLKLLVNEGLLDNINAPKYILVGGEAIDESLWLSLTKAKYSQVYNLYGPTECTVDTTIAKVNASHIKSNIGSGISNIKTYILDSHLQLLPIGIIGELHIGGDGLAKGYFNNPQLTAEKFINNPFGEGKLYKTGDLCRYLPDGNIELIGRIDNQVKIRGFRVELGEIEGNLNQHPHIKDSLVIALENSQQNKYLTAYIIPDNQNKIKQQELTQFLADKLPEYMIPLAFVFMDAFPLTINGKIDVKALPLPDIEANREDKFIPPRTPIEETLVKIWQELLEIESISVTDSFFALGGHSLLAVKMVYEIKKELTIDLSLAYLWENSTIEKLALKITQQKILALTPDTLFEIISHNKLDIVSHLSLHQRLILEKQLNNLNDETLIDVNKTTLPQIHPRLEDKYQPFPLTDIQEAYWVGRSYNFELGNVGAHGYYEVDTLDFDLAKFETAWQKLCDRHEMLRARILDNGSQQILKTIPPYKIEIVDLSDKEETQRESKLIQIRHHLEAEVLNCTQPPLFKIKATNLGQGKIRLHISYDVLILDGWSMRILFQELFQLYHHPETELSSLQLSFRDYVLALKQIKNSSQYQQAKDYWLKRIETLPPRPELPLCKQAKTIIKPNFKLVENKLDQPSWLKLKQKGAKENITPSIILLTAFAEVLRLWNKNPQFTINLTYFDRIPLHSQIDEIVGDFTSIVLLAVENNLSDNFLSKAKQLQKQLWLDLDHNLFTGVEVLRELAKKQHSNPQALMPIVFTSFLPHGHQKNLTTPLMWMGDIQYRSSQTPQVWLDYVAVETEGELNLSWNFVEDLFPEGMLEGMFTAYFNLLQRLIHDDNIWHENSLNLKLKILPTSQLIVDLASLKNPPVVTTHETLLHQLFTKQVAYCGKEIAVIASDKTLTYKQLSQLVNKVAYGLGKLKVQPNQLVAVIMEKGWEQIVAVLAILTAGGAYVPIDSKLPPERIRYILDEAEVKVILTQSTVNSSICLSGEAPRNILCIDEVESWDYPDTPFTPEIIPQVTDLAYIIYTSGSTGQPKGVMIDHRGAVNTILDVNERFNVKKGDSILALSSLSFDLSVYDIFGTLAGGGIIVLPDSTQVKNPSHWASLIQQHRITIWNSVPTLMTLMQEYLEDSAFSPSISSLRLVLLSGDWIPVTLPQRIKSLAPNAQIISLGGATEASIWSIVYPIGNIKQSWGSIPYGKGMQNQNVYVLDEDLIPCPIWVEGDLYVSGMGLSLGYWKNPLKTENSFITHPQTGVRLYRTGDLGRYLPDGNIEFIGRKDFQVKIQGNRVELGEIEAVLRQIAEVKEVVINSIGESQQEKRLIAYLTTSKTINTDDIRKFLAQRLPDYMIPAHFIILEQLPLNSNGKIDRNSLPIPSVETTVTSSPLFASVSPQVEKITLMVAEILNLDTVKPDDNWLSLGATSIDMIRIANRLDNEFAFRPTIDQLYQEGNAIAISKLLPIESSLDVSFNPALKGIIPRQKPKKKDYDLIIDPQERKLFTERQHGLRNDINKPVICLPKSTLELRNYQQRASIREFSQEIISLTELSQFLTHLSQIKLNNNPKYLYPSAGSLYPVQTYLFIKPERVEGINAGIYYYHPVNHNLTQLSPVEYLDDTTYEKLVNRPIYQSSAFAIFFIAKMDAIAPLYGEYARDFALIETGAMVQLLMNKAFECNLGICAIGSVDFAKIEEFFDLSEEHLLLHSLLGGKISPTILESQNNNLSDIYWLNNKQQEEDKEREQFEF